MLEKFNTIISDKKPVLIDFYAEWCGPCKMLSPHLKTAKEQIQDAGKIVKINVDKYPDIAAEFGVRGVPTLILFKEGVSLWRQSGFISAPEIVKLFHTYGK